MSARSSSVADSAPSVASDAAKVGSSSKLWFLTFNPENNDVFIWKTGIRLKLSDGTSTGKVLSATIAHDTILTVSIKHGYYTINNVFAYSLQVLLMMAAGGFISPAI